MAESNTWLREAANLAYRRKYGRVILYLDSRFDWLAERFYHTDTELWITHFKRSLKFMRYFRNSVSRILVTRESRSVVHTIRLYRLLSYANEFCSTECLTEIEFIEYISSNEESTIALKYPFQPFKNVQTVKMRILHDISALVELKRNINLYPQLKQLEIDVLGRILPHLKSVLRSIPQLKSLSIPFVSDESFYRCISEDLPLLEMLKFTTLAPTNFFNYDVHFRNLKKLQIYCKSESDRTLDPNQMYSIDQLEELDFRSLPWYELDDDFVKFITKNPTIAKIKCNCIAKVMGAGDLARILPTLTEICDFGFCDDPLPYLNEIKTLRKFSFRMNMQDIDSQLRQRIPNGWHLISDNATQLCSVVKLDRIS